MRHVLERVNDEFQNVYNVRTQRAECAGLGGSTACASKLRACYRAARRFLAVPCGFDARAAFRRWLFGRCLCRLFGRGFSWKLCGRSWSARFCLCRSLLVVELFFFGASPTSPSVLVRPLPCCTNCSTRERTNHGPDDGYAQCRPGHGASRGSTQSAPSRAYACISGTLILIFVVHVSLPTLTETTLASVSLAVNKRLFVMHYRETRFAPIDPQDWLPTPPLSCRALANERRKKAHPRQ